MENAYPVVEFEAEVTDRGTLVVPGPIARALTPGTKVTVRLTHGVVASALRRRRGVTEDEVEQIASRQLEPRDNVLRFLSAEGALAASPRFSRRGRAERP